jgi:hypothetical protein
MKNMKKLILLIMFVSFNAFSFGGYYTFEEREQMERENHIRYQKELQRLKYCEQNPDECYKVEPKNTGPDYIQNGLNTRTQILINRGDLDPYFDEITETNLRAKSKVAKVQARDYYNQSVQNFRNSENKRASNNAASKRELARNLCRTYGYIPREYRGKGLPDCSTLKMQTSFSNFSYMRRQMGYNY